MRPAILSAGLIIVSACAAFGQAAGESPTFEVASVKPAEAQGMGMMRVMMRGGPGSVDPGQITYSNVSMKSLLTTAYGVKGYQISGPSWLDSERFDVVAKIAKGATKEQFQVMFQNLLAERFKLTLHRETKDLPMYALVVGKGGPKLKVSAEDAEAAPGATPQGGASGPGGPSAFAPPTPPPPPPGSDGAGPVMNRVKVGADGMPQLPPGMGKKGMMMMMGNGRFHMVGNAQPISALIDMLGNQTGRPVVDATELKAKYDFNLDFAPDGLNGPMGPMGMMPPPQHDGGPGAGAPMASGPDNAGPTIFTALQEQLGLKLEQRKGPMEMLVIDRLEKVPTEN